MGDPIEIICSIEPPPSDTFGGTVASVSINGSTDFSLAQLNSNSVIDGIDLGRYSANINGLIPSIDMPVIRLIINSYLPLDSDTIFLCATTFNNGTVYDSTVSGSPKTEAGLLYSFIFSLLFDISILSSSSFLSCLSHSWLQLSNLFWYCTASMDTWS